jgi:hypothetical protein
MLIKCLFYFNLKKNEKLIEELKNTTQVQL